MRWILNKSVVTKQLMAAKVIEMGPIWPAPSRGCYYTGHYGAQRPPLGTFLQFSTCRLGRATNKGSVSGGGRPCP